MDYDFTSDWFSQNIPTWRDVLRRQELKPSKILEIGPFEGKATTWMVENLFGDSGGEIYAVDTWSGGIEHNKDNMPLVEQRFDNNISVAMNNRPLCQINKLKGDSTVRLAELISLGHSNTFDLIYVDGSHEAPDVFADMALAFKLCRVGGIITCDDYMWDFGRDPIYTPKIAIDAFVNCHAYKVRVILAWLYQLYIVKIKA